MKKNIFYTIAFIILLSNGFYLSSQKPLWSDEILSQTLTINQSYSDLLLKKNPQEGNVSPLFYILQKSFCDLFGFRTPTPWLNGHWEYRDMAANIFLRILPVVWMSLSFLLFLIYFSKRFNLWVGIFSLSLALSSSMLWSYWAEARPYGLWILLTVCQMIIFCELFQKQPFQLKKWVLLSLVHLALSLTCALSFVQISVIYFLLFLKERRWIQCIFLLLLPLCFIYFYKPISSFNNVLVIAPVNELIFNTIPKEKLWVLCLYPLMLTLVLLYKRFSETYGPESETFKKCLPLFTAIYLMILSVVLFLAYLKSHSTGSSQMILSRHVIFLVPLGVFGISYLVGTLWETVKQPWWLNLFIFILITLLLIPTYR